MGRLAYTVLCSLDGYTADADGAFDWAAPDEEVHAFVNDLERPVGTVLYGRRMYETLAVWQTIGGAEESAIANDYAEIWRAADKIVYSSTLPEVTTARARIERAFDADAIRELKTSATSDLTIGGANFTAHAFEAGLVDECHLFICPVFVGAGKPALPTDTRADLELLDERRFDNGEVYVRYRVR